MKCCQKYGNNCIVNKVFLYRTEFILDNNSLKKFVFKLDFLKVKIFVILKGSFERNSNFFSVNQASILAMSVNGDRWFTRTKTKKHFWQKKLAAFFLNQFIQIPRYRTNNYWFRAKICFQESITIIGNLNPFEV